MHNSIQNCPPSGSSGQTEFTGSAEILPINSSHSCPSLSSSVLSNLFVYQQQNERCNEVRQFAYVLGAGGRDFIDSTTNTICTLHTIQEGSALLFIAKETQEFRKPQLDSSPIQKQSLYLERRDRYAPDTPVGRPLVDRPKPGRPCSTERSSCQ